jgi:hypothetical protein
MKDYFYAGPTIGFTLMEHMAVRFYTSKKIAKMAAEAIWQKEFYWSPYDGKIPKLTVEERDDPWSKV